MLLTVAYFAVAGGCHEGGMSLTDSFVWPWSVGKMIARRAKEMED